MRFQKLPTDYVASLALSSDTSDFLTTVGLPTEIPELKHSIELNFYSDKRIIKKWFKGTNYVVIGDDSGTRLAISLDDDHVYSVDFDNLISTNPICFVNSRIDKFVESIRCFIEFKVKAEIRDQSENQLKELMKKQITDIDKRALEDGTWWAQIIDEPI